MRILGVVSSSSREVPNAPTIGTATDVGTGRAFNNGAATVTFTAPTWTGGLPITGYVVKAYNSAGVYQNISGSGSSSPITVTGLTSSADYKYTVYATNTVGNSSESSFSNLVTATTVPQAPTIGTATAGTASATVTFTGNATGGKAVSTYTATSSPGSITGSSATSPITVSGLSNGQPYTFTVTATNANGTSAASAASNSVTPTPPKPVVTGGTLTSDATYYYRTFTTNGTLSISTASLVADYLVLSGGAAGGYSYVSYSKGFTYRGVGGGGGSGGVSYLTSQTLTVGSRAITIGAGGAGSTNVSLTNGSASSFNGYSPAGGGGGGVAGIGYNGGSGGGGGAYWNNNSTAGSGAAGTATGGGNNGGNGRGDVGTQTAAGGGGGGLGAVGQAAYQTTDGGGFPYNRAGNGGNGTAYFGTTYGGGGGGGGWQYASNIPGSGGTGGGGNGAAGTTTNPTAGAANLGAGGGGAGTNNARVGGNGGSGIVVIRYTRAQVD